MPSGELWRPSDVRAHLFFALSWTGTAFAARATHPLPASLNPPPAAWAVDFPAMAAEAGLSTDDYREAFAILVAFWDAGSHGKADGGGAGGFRAS